MDNIYNVIYSVKMNDKEIASCEDFKIMNDLFNLLKQYGNYTPLQLIETIISRFNYSKKVIKEFKA